MDNHIKTDNNSSVCPDNPDKDVVCGGLRYRLDYDKYQKSLNKSNKGKLSASKKGLIAAFIAVLALIALTFAGIFIFNANAAQNNEPKFRTCDNYRCEHACTDSVTDDN